jgi:predicted metal-binding membrane protein
VDEALKSSALERVLRHDRVVTLIALCAVALAAWGFILAGAGMDGHAMPKSGMAMPGMAMPDMVMPMAAHWTASYAALIFAMWAVMMVAMMLPSAAPMILLFGTIERRRGGSPFWATTVFASAYLMVWAGFGLAATLLQWQIARMGLLSSAMASTSRLFAGLVLIGAGIYQFTPLKQSCLRNCRSPLEFITQYWSKGPFGIGLRHGAYCLGCCWMLMLLLFIGGIMNLLWIALIAAFVFAEKVLPRGEWLSYAAGAALAAWGAWTLYQHALA